MVNIYDIARLSGVSKSTVSRVIANQPYVSEEKRNKVNKVIEELNYKPNSLARQFRKKQTNCIGILVPDLDHPYFSQLVGMLSLRCHEKGFKPVVYQTFFNRELEKEVYAKLQNREMDGLILTSTLLTEEELSTYVENHFVAACNEDFEGKYFSVFCLNEEKAIFDATMYLLNKGVTTLGFCSDNLHTPSQQARLRGFISAHEQKGINYNESLVFKQIATIEDGIQLGQSLFEGPVRIEGIITGSDFVAAGMLKSSAEKHIRVPTNFSIIGFDDHPISLVSTPPLTTICNQMQEMGNDLIDCITKMIKDQQAIYTKKVYEGKLILRQST